MLEIWLSPRAGKRNTYTHRDKGQVLLCFSPETTYHPILHQKKPEMRIFRELIFRMIHSQKGRKDSCKTFFGFFIFLGKAAFLGTKPRQ